MDSSLSEDEFQRMQIQLLELRTSNYQYEDQCKRKERELISLRSDVEVLNKELQKATKTISKSKKAKEVELLIQENESLQLKLFSQEDDFRLQNQTLMQELNNLVTANEELEKSLKDGAGPNNAETSGGSEDEIRRLQAQNSALQKNLTTCQEKYEGELGTLRQTVSDLESQCAKMSGQRMTPVGENSSDEPVDGQSDPETFHEEDTPQKPDLNDSSMSTKSSVQSQMEEQSRHINELSLSLDTEREEKGLLLTQLQELEKSSKEQSHSLHEEVDKLTEKFKKKQESYVHLQEEKEKMYTQLNDRIHTLEMRKVEEVKVLTVRSTSLQSDLAQCSQTLEEVRQSSSQKICDLETQVQEFQEKHKMLEEHEQKSHVRIQQLEDLVASLEEEVDEAGLEQSQSLVNEVEQVKRDNHKLKQQNMVLQKHIEELTAQLKESKESHQAEINERVSIKQDRDTQVQALQEANKVAEKRKSLLDELAIKYQTATDQHREQSKTVEEQHETQVNGLNTHIEEIEKKLRKLRDIESKLEESNNKVKSLENTKSWLERTLKDTDENLESTKSEYEVKLKTKDEELETEVSRLQEQHSELTEELKQKHSADLQDLEKKIENLLTEIKKKEEDISTLQQTLNDNFDAKKIHEKKGMTVVKDLKKQLHAERKRGDKLQEKLQEYLQSDSRSRTSVEELMRPSDSNDRFPGDSSSVCSWSTGGLGRDSHLQSPDEDTTSVSFDQEHTDLLTRIAELQQNKWTLETKVSHLESSNAAMCDDLISKTGIIEHYVMHSKTGTVAPSNSQDKLSFKTVIDFVKNKGDDDMKEMNRKLQAILEETLTKNMHLEKDMETLSQELVRLSKQAVQPAGIASQQSQSAARDTQPASQPSQ